MSEEVKPIKIRTLDELLRAMVWYPLLLKFRRNYHENDSIRLIYHREAKREKHSRRKIPYLKDVDEGIEVDLAIATAFEQSSHCRLIRTNRSKRTPYIVTRQYGLSDTGALEAKVSGYENIQKCGLVLEFDRESKLEPGEVI